MKLIAISTLDRAQRFVSSIPHVTPKIAHFLPLDFRFFCRRDWDTKPVLSNLHQNEAQLYIKSSVLEEENKRWDQLLADYRKNLDNEVNLVSVNYNGPFDVKKYQHFDYSDILEDAHHKGECLNFQIDKLKQTKKCLKTNVTLMNKAILSLSEEAGKNFAKTFQETPRSLIKKCFK
ncbi:uncharacterized protein TNCT_518221 [Trichonephila clavata]|uniref:Uncharacterized protein n=1 Tax=Trichonephila clavata TaxID=2740835 RepID=A0A8X6M448_TRICU|nr:uncharacterized protein TNCT_518221 [Trichonephila clavata]